MSKFQWARRNDLYCVILFENLVLNKNVSSYFAQRMVKKSTDYHKKWTAVYSGRCIVENFCKTWNNQPQLLWTCFVPVMSRVKLGIIKLLLWKNVVFSELEIKQSKLNKGTKHELDELVFLNSHEVFQLPSDHSQYIQLYWFG